MLIRFWKPYGVLCQFTDPENRPTLADYIAIPNVYAAGRMDLDSEGLLLLTDHGPTATQLSSPKFEKVKTYWVQVEGIPEESQLEVLRNGLKLKDGITLPCEARRMEVEPDLPDRNPPIRVRKLIPTSWLELKIKEGKNRQVRRMTAAIGFPTLRLVRWAIDDITLSGLAEGAMEIIQP